MPDKEGWARIRPNGSRDWHVIRILSGYLALIAIVFATAFFVRHKQREEMEQSWESATAVIEEVRPTAAAVMNTNKGGGMLYEVAILAKYTADGVDQERWIKVQQQLESLDDAQLQAFRWKGKQCIVRWKPSDPNKVIAEVS
jgi:flagellar basal body-associated protein FliL